MLRYHMMVVTPDKVLKRAVKRLTTATGAMAVFVEHERDIPADSPIDLAIFDARKRNPDQAFLSKVPARGRVLYILEGQNLAQRITLFETTQATSLFCYNDQFDDDEFISSATKALRGDVFGLQKYFPWGVTTFTMLVKNYEEKTKAIDIMMSYAQMAGVRGPVRDRVQLVADELMMNGLYHAPTDDKGKELYRGQTQKELAHLPEVAPIEVQYGCSGRYFGISVRDGFGSLTRDKALSYLKRAGNDQAMIESKKSGAGLGLVSVLQSVSKLIFNLDPGYSTEAVGLFDMQVQSRGLVGARSLHIFVADPGVPTGPEAGAEQAPRASSSNAGTWAFAAVLGAIVAALGTAYYMTTTEEALSQEHSAATLTVVPTPGDSLVTLDGAPLQAGSPHPLEVDTGTMTIEVSKDGFETWSKTVKPSSTSSTIYVDLSPAL